MNLKIIYTLTLLLISQAFFAQKASLQGKILDKNTNEPLPFANILIDGTNFGTTSDNNGNFTFEGIKPGFIKLKASFVGYKPAL